MRTSDEIVARITSLSATGLDLDFFGVQRADLVEFLPFDFARPFLKDGVTKEMWDKDRAPNAEDATVVAKIVDYLPFAWGKANDCRGLSAARSLDHMKAWLWILGENEAARQIVNYSLYGKPQLRAISEAVGFSWRAVDDGRWCDDEFSDGTPAPAETIDIGLTRQFTGLTSTAVSFPTLHVASALTGMGLCLGMTYSDVQKVYDQLAGYPIFTHEMGTGDTVDRIVAHARPKYPMMPTPEEAMANFSAAAAKAIAAYGETMLVERGTLTREKSPMETLEEMVPGITVVVVSADE